MTINELGQTVDALGNVVNAPPWMTAMFDAGGFMSGSPIGRTISPNSLLPPDFYAPAGQEYLLETGGLSPYRAPGSMLLPTAEANTLSQWLKSTGNTSLGDLGAKLVSAPYDYFNPAGVPTPPTPITAPKVTAAATAPSSWTAPIIPGTAGSGTDDIFSKTLGKGASNLGGLLGKSSPYSNPFKK
jgi:hypothetical protein